MPEKEISVTEWNRMVDDALEHHEKIRGRRTAVEWRAPVTAYWTGITNRYVTADMIRRFAFSIGDPNPLWSDPNYARNTRWGSIIAPPVFEMSFGQPHGIRETIHMPGFNNFDGGIAREYYTVIRPGDQVVYGVDTYLGCTDKTKPGSPNRTFLEQGQRELFNEKGEKVLKIIGSAILVGTPPGSEGASQQPTAKIVRPHYTKEQLEALYTHYDEELVGKWRRGSETRYWEDVTEGEEINPVIKGPLDDSDLRSFMGGSMGYTAAFAGKWALNKKEPRRFIHPETGAYKSDWDWHSDDEEAQRRGLAYAIAEGKQNQTVIGHAVSNWMGDDAFLKKMDLRNKAVKYLGDMDWGKGKVNRKYIEKGEHLVELEVWAECQDGRIHTSGTATVRLVSRGK